VKKYLIIIFLVLASSFSLLCQTVSFNKDYNYAGQYFISSDFIVTQDSNYVVVGMEGSSAINGYFIMKINPFGDTLWYRQHYDTLLYFHIAGKKIIEVRKDHYLLISRVQSNMILLSEFDKNGNKSYEQQLNYNQKSLSLGSAVKVDNHLFMTMTIQDSSADFRALMKLDTMLNILSVHDLHSFYPDSGPEVMIKYSTNNIILSGSLFDSLLNSYVPALIQIDTAGQLIRSLILPDTGTCIINSVKSVHSNSILFTEYIFSNGIIANNLFLLDSLFNNQLLVQQQPSLTDYKSCSQSSDSLYYFTYPSANTANVEIIEKVDSIGNTLWTGSIPVTNPEIIMSGMKLNWNNEIIICGWSGDGVHSSHNTFLAVIIDTMKFTNLTVIKNDVAQIRIFPNPTTGIFSIAYSINTPAKSCIEIFSPLGEKLLMKELYSNSNSTEVDLSEFKLAIYFYKIIVDNVVVDKGTISIMR
jgi:hypothetical protein